VQNVRRGLEEAAPSKPDPASTSEAEIRSRTWQKCDFFSERAAGEENLHVMATYR